MMRPWSMVLSVALAAIGANAALPPHSVALTHMTSSVGKDIPVEIHKKEAGNGYLKGSPLYKKQQKMAEPAPEKEESDRSKPSLLVIFGAILIGLAILACAAMINKRELVPGVAKYEQKMQPTSQTRLQSQRLGTPPEYVEYAVPQQAPIEYVRPGSSYALPVSSGVVYSSGSLPPQQIQGSFTPQYASMPPPRYGDTPPMSRQMSVGGGSVGGGSVRSLR